MKIRHNRNPNKTANFETYHSGLQNISKFNLWVPCLWILFERRILSKSEHKPRNIIEYLYVLVVIKLIRVFAILEINVI